MQMPTHVTLIAEEVYIVIQLHLTRMMRLHVIKDSTANHLRRTLTWTESTITMRSLDLTWVIYMRTWLTLGL
jgi:hypothetical protein